MSCALGTGVQTCALQISFARSGKRRQASASAAACTGLRPWAIHASVSAGSNGSDIIGLLRCESQETWRRWSEGTAYRSDSFSITHTTGIRSEEHTSELQSLMRNSYAVFCLKKKTKRNNLITNFKRCLHLNNMQQNNIQNIHNQTIKISRSHSN